MNAAAPHSEIPDTPPTQYVRSLPPRDRVRVAASYVVLAVAVGLFAWIVL